MSDFIEPRSTPETPWEFFPDDDIREEPEPAAEDAAMHIEVTNVFPVIPPAEIEPVVHYMEDEDPEIPDLSEPVIPSDRTPEVEDLLIRQHYMSQDEAN